MYFPYPPLASQADSPNLTYAIGCANVDMSGWSRCTTEECIDSMWRDISGYTFQSSNGFFIASACTINLQYVNFSLNVF